MLINKLFTAIIFANYLLEPPVDLAYYVKCLVLHTYYLVQKRATDDKLPLHSSVPLYSSNNKEQRVPPLSSLISTTIYVPWTAFWAPYDRLFGLTLHSLLSIGLLCALTNLPVIPQPTATYRRCGPANRFPLLRRRGKHHLYQCHKIASHLNSVGFIYPRVDD